MEKQKTLVIMAAGMGSRFGGLKQLTPIDNNGNFIIDYSIFDAIRNGFNEVVFIIKKEHYDLFRSTVGRRIESNVATKYVFQEMDNIPEGYSVPADRKKPLGTAHAIYCAKSAISHDFAVINADDFYGEDAFKTARDFLNNNSSADQYALVGYKAENTIADTGSVKRGICATSKGKLKSITESSIWQEGDHLVAQAIDNENAPIVRIPNGTTVSMNMFCFTKQFLNHIEPYFKKFLSDDKGDPMTKECYLPLLVSDLIKSGKAEVDVKPTKAVWYGMTYKEDHEKVSSSIAKLVEKGEYPKSLWQNRVK